MFTGPVGPVEVFFYWPEAVLGNFYWPGAIGSPLVSSPAEYHYPYTPASATNSNILVSCKPPNSLTFSSILCLNFGDLSPHKNFWTFFSIFFLWWNVLGWEETTGCV